MSSSSAQFLSSSRPWRLFLDLSAFSLPISFSDATNRLRNNLYYFRFNYTLITLLLLFLGLIFHPFSIIVFLFTFAAWLYLYLYRDEPLVLLNWTIDDRFVLAFLSLLTAVALLFTRVWLNVFVSLALSAIILSVHASMRAPEDIADYESTYGPLLSVVDSPRGAFSPV